MDGVPAPGSRTALGAGLLGAALGLSAWAFDAEPLWVAAGALVALAVIAYAWVRLAADRAGVTRTLAVHRIQEGEEVPVTIDVRAGGGLPFPGGAVQDTLVRRPVDLRAGGRGVRIRARARFDRRGLHGLPPTRVTVADPFGLSARRLQAGGEDDEVLVLPRIEPVLTPGDGQEAGRPAQGRLTGAAATDIDGVGPLRDGTPASRVYWPAVARGAEPLERRFRPDGDGRPLVVLDPRAPATADDLDAAVRATASLVVHLARAGGCWLLLPGDRRPIAVEPSLAGWDTLHARLALVHDRQVPALSSLVGRRGAVLLVSARRRDRPPTTLQGGARTLVVPGELAGRGPVFTVAGCHGYAIGRPARRVATRAAS